jgi:ribosomal protein S7
MKSFKPFILFLFLIICANITLSQSTEFYGDSPPTSISIIPRNLPLSKIPVNVYVQRYVEGKITEWQKKGEFETLAAYQSRVNEKARNDKVQQLTNEALDEFKKEYTNSINWQSLELSKYDADNQTFLIKSKQFSDFAISVPISEAPAFRDSWHKVHMQKQDYYVLNDKLVLAKMDFVTPTGKRYSYDSKQSTLYAASNISYNFKPIEVEVKQDAIQTTQTRIESKDITVGKSDVDLNIPVNPQTNNKTFVLIIANENYRREAKVPFALNDGSVFKEYCEKTLGIPSKNIHFSKDATFGEMRSEISWLTQVMAAFKGEAKIIVYYAGHGMPDEKDRTAYLLPTDGFSSDYQTAIKLDFLCESLSQQPAQSITIFLDACFSGANREDRMLAAESGQRAVRVRPREGILKGNMVVVSASTGDETAFPYKEKQHGLFTYFLLQKLQQTKGNVDLNTLTSHIISNVTQQSILINNKSQTPQVNVAPEIQNIWKNYRLK